MILGKEKANSLTSWLGENEMGYEII